MNEWFVHSGTCDKCASVDINRPATLALACLRGAPLLKDHLNKTVPRPKRERVVDPNRVSKDKLRSVMRYKGDNNE